MASISAALSAILLRSCGEFDRLLGSTGDGIGSFAGAVSGPVRKKSGVVGSVGFFMRIAFICDTCRGLWTLEP